MKNYRAVRILRQICIFLLVLGIGFRCVNLGKKVYWHDEVYTSMGMTAHSRSELVDALFTGKEVTRSELQALQQIDPDRTLGQMWNSLGQEDPQHPPFYYLVGWHWIRVFGDSVVAIRSLSVIFGLLMLGCLYWFCWELFESTLVAWVAVGLVAISPFHVLYAQEAREYSLWAALILLLSTLLLRSLRFSFKHSPITFSVSWGLYFLTLTVSLYTFLFTALVSIAHGVYLLLNGAIEVRRGRLALSSKAIAYLCATAAAVVALGPWVYFLVRYADVVEATTAWAKVGLPWVKMLRLSAMNFGRIFLDFDLNPDSHGGYLLALPVLILEVYALYFVYQNTPRRVSSFILTLTFVPLIVLALPDLISGGQRSVVTRYLVPCFLGAHIAVAYTLAQQLQSIRVVRRFVWRAIAALVVLGGIVSCGLSAQADTWWTKVVSYTHPAIARTLNDAPQPIVISDAFGVNPGNMVALSYLTDEKVKFFLIPEVWRKPTIPNISDRGADLFLVNLPEPFREEVAQSFGKKLTEMGPDFWKLTP